MADAVNDNPRDPELIRKKLNHDTARIHWSELAEAQQQGLVVKVSTDLDLIETACQFTLDNSEQVQAWMERAQVQKVDAEQAQGWGDEDRSLWAVVVAPWVLVQELKPGHS